MRLKLQTGKGSCWGGGGASVFFVFPLCLFPKKKIFGLSLFSLSLSLTPFEKDEPLPTRVCIDIKRRSKKQRRS